MRPKMVVKLCLVSMLVCYWGFSFGQNAGDAIIQTKKGLDTARQTDLIDIGKALFRIRPGKIREEKDKKLYFSILPIGGTVPGGTGNALITSTSAAMYLGPKKSTNLSTATFTPYWNLGSRFGLPVRTNIWLPDNTWLIQGDTRFLVYPQYTWGLGESKVREERTLLSYKYIRFYQNVLKRIKPYLYAGLGYNLDYRFNIRTEDSSPELEQYAGYQYGTGNNSFSSGLVLILFMIPGAM